MLLLLLLFISQFLCTSATVELDATTGKITKINDVQYNNVNTFYDKISGARKVHFAACVKFGEVVIKDCAKSASIENERKVLEKLKLEKNDYAIHVHDIAEARDRIYFVEESGIPFEHVDKFDCDVMVRIWKAALHIIQYLHSKGIAHLDLLPINFVLVKQIHNGNHIVVLKVIDFEKSSMKENGSAPDHQDVKRDVNRVIDKMMRYVLERHRSLDSKECDSRTYAQIRHILDLYPEPSLDDLLKKNKYQMKEQNPPNDAGLPLNFVDYFDNNWQKMEANFRSTHV
ncbi:protein kinase domain-containing protein [Ditylenchus destructor]|uniref:Protein kinase domain-containing protein n=1 Tax=Ditylenchus destructor TaxID=166010 RepID=A0AAD4R0U7_9BILA|nr:protein kinase domain-containing protein [Ditylenchus destructor]